MKRVSGDFDGGFFCTAVAISEGQKEVEVGRGEGLTKVDEYALFHRLY